MPRTHKQTVGSIGEDIACQHLVRLGFTIKARNIHFSHNEIDIIAENDRYIIFVEVKTRSVIAPDVSQYGSAGRAVDKKKRLDTVRAVRAYLSTYKGNKQPRLDVIEVYLTETSPSLPSPALLKINHIESAFDARGKIH